MKRYPLLIALILLALIITWLAWPRQRITETVIGSAPGSSIVHPPRGFVADWSSLNDYQGTLSAKELRDALENVYTIGDTWHEVISIREDLATIQTAGDPFLLRLRPEDVPPPQEVRRYWREGSLKGLRIAIDPGHIGGEFSAIEERDFGVPGDRRVREGEIALQAARHLQPLLEKQGALVSLVRTENAPVTPLRPSALLTLYQEYNPGVPAGLLRPAAERRFYLREEIVARARLINEQLRPDLVLCLHYNASDGSGAWASPERPVFVGENHFHLLINGAYTDGEVLDEGDRFQMLERILQRIHAREAAMGEIVAQVFAEKTGLPPYAYDPNSPRAKQVGDGPYVWARNLLANRSYTCPVLFFEPWVMNHREVYERIQEGDYEGNRLVEGVERPSIMREYAEAVAAGIEAFYAKP
jgi:N-acetylmuramoyl-L-alanine amidase